MIVFKYTAHAKKMLQGRTVKVSTASELNDPFELFPTISQFTVSPADVRAYLLREETIRQLHLLHGRGEPFPKFKKKHLASLPRLVAQRLPRVPMALEDAQQKYAAAFDKRFRMFCASRRHDSTLMWSHYAEDHRGCVIGFDLEKSAFLGVAPPVVVIVDYDDARAPFAFAEGDKKMVYKSFLKIAGRKSRDWHYENEVRLLFPNETDSTVKMKTDGVAFVIFGCRCPQSDRDEIMAIVSDPAFAHVSIYQANRNKDHFKLDFMEVRKGSCGLAPIHPNAS